MCSIETGQRRQAATEGEWQLTAIVNSTGSRLSEEPSLWPSQERNPRSDELKWEELPWMSAVYSTSWSPELNQKEKVELRRTLLEFLELTIGRGVFSLFSWPALGDPAEASVIMYASPHAVTRHMQNCNERNCQRRKWAERGHYSLFLGCGGNVTSCHKLPSVCFPDNECPYPQTVSPNNPSFPSVASARLSGHSKPKSSSYRKPVAGHASPGGKLTFKSSNL